MSSSGSTPASGAPGFDDLSYAALRRRTSAKWTTYPPDVLPAFVAEMDFPLAEPVRAALAEAVRASDSGYPSPGPLAAAYAAFAAERYGWSLDPDLVRPVVDVMTAVSELLLAFSGSGDQVVVNPPIYPPFLSVTSALGRRVAEAPLVCTAAGYELDLDALERAFALGARVHLLSNPHNPSGRSFRRGELEAVATLAARYGVLVVSDEVHAPLTLPGAEHVPFLSLGGEAASHGVALVSASKAWNLAGLKCALIVAASPAVDAQLAERLPPSLRYHVGHFGVIASLAAFERGLPWLERLVEHLGANRERLGVLLAQALPEIAWVPPEAGYLAWLDCRGLELGDDPAASFLERGRVALSSGPGFGTQGRGFARLNFATSSALLAEAVERMANAVRDPRPL